MMNRFRFEGCEIVRLKHDHPEDNLKSGDCGLVWGVYDLSPPLYEASFVDQSGKFVDRMFQEYEVEEVTDMRQVRFKDQLEKFRKELEDWNATIREENRRKGNQQ